MEKRVVGIDIGGTNLRLALANNEGVFIRSAKEKTDHENIIAQLKRHLDKMPKFGAIGISSIGPLDSHNGIILNPANSEIRNLHISEILRDKYKVPVVLLNDCVAAVTAEKFLGSGKNVKNLVYVTFSTGIGAGAIMDDRLVLGKDGNGHEVGHWTLDYQSELPCGCGGKGHWESFSSGKNIPQFAKHLLNTVYRKEAPNNGREIKILDTPGIFIRAKTDKLALRIIEQVAKVNAVGLGNIISAYDPELITIGGSVMLNNSQLLLPMIREELSKYTVNRMPKIAITGLGEDICTIGAVASVLNYEWTNKALTG